MSEFEDRQRRIEVGLADATRRVAELERRLNSSEQRFNALRLFGGAVLLWWIGGSLWAQWMSNG